MGVSANWCLHCCQFEPIYAAIHELLKETQSPVSFLRIDSGKEPYIKRYTQGTEDMPQLYVLKEGHFYHFNNELRPEVVQRFVQHLEKPVKDLATEEEVEEFLDKMDDRPNAVNVLGFFYEEDRDADSDYGHFSKTALTLASWINLELAQVTDKSLIKSLRSKGKFVTHLDSILITRKDAKPRIMDLALRSQDMTIHKWVLLHSVGLVEELTAYNFSIYKLIGLPMLMLFLDRNNIHHDDYLDMFAKVADIFENQVKFVWVDGTDPIMKQKKRALGLVTEILPAVAFNLLEDRTLPFDEAKPLTYDNLLGFVRDYVEHRVVSRRNKPEKLGNKELEEAYRNTPRLHTVDFEKEVLQEGYDVVVLFFSSFGNEESLRFAPYYNKMAQRFAELEFPNVKVFRLDVAVESVPKHIKIDSLPAIYFFPAFHKQPPYIHYTGMGKVLPLMFFIEKYADIRFELPELPHLHPNQISAYYEQKAELSPEKQKKVEEANERRHWDL